MSAPPCRNRLGFGLGFGLGGCSHLHVEIRHADEPRRGAVCEGLGAAARGACVGVWVRKRGRHAWMRRPMGDTGGSKGAPAVSGVRKRSDRGQKEVR